MFKEKFYRNVITIEKSLFSSKSFGYIKETGLEREVVANLVGEVFKLSIQGAANLQELEMKQKADELNYLKMQSEIELAILNTKAQIKVARAEALKALIQAKSMIRSVSDNAAINRANAYVGLSNCVANATNSIALTSGNSWSLSDGTRSSLAMLAAENIEKINVSVMTDFDDTLKDLIDADDNFGCKDVIIHAAMQNIALGDNLHIIGISSYGENKTSFSLSEDGVNFAEVAINTRNYIFNGEKLGTFYVKFTALNDDETPKEISDTLQIKVENSALNDSEMSLKKF